MVKGNKKKRNYLLIIFILLIALPILFFLKSSKENKDSSSQILQKYFENKVDKNIYEQREFVYENAEKLNQEDATSLLEDYLSTLDAKASSLYYYGTYIRDDLTYYVDKDLATEYKSIKNKVVIGLFEEAAQLDIKAIKIGEYYDFLIDIDKIYKEVNLNVKPDYKELTKLLANTAYEDPLNGNYEVDIEKIVKKLDKIYSLIEKYPESDYLTNFENLKDDYYNLIFSVSHQAYMEDVETQKLVESHLESVKNSVKYISNLTFKENINNVLGLIDKNNNCLNSIIIKQIESY